MKFLFKSLIIILIYLNVIPLLYSGPPKIISVTMSNPSPDFGELVEITVVACVNKYSDGALAIAVSNYSTRQAPGTGGQVFVVSNDGIDYHIAKPSEGAVGIGINAAPQNSADSNDCQDCSNDSNSRTFTWVYSVHIPNAEDFPGCNVTNLYLHVGMKDSYLGTGDWVGLGACSTSALSWQIPVPPSDFSIHKRVEGVAQNNGDLILFSIDYSYGNGQLIITDDLPAGNVVEFVEAGPSTMVTSQPAVGATSGTIQWTLPDRAGQRGSASGTVWFLVRLKKPPANIGDVIQNTAVGTMSGVGTKTGDTSLTVGQPAMNVEKYESDTLLQYGDTITYYLSYDINGSKLQTYRPFDNLSGVYNSGTGPPQGWKFNPFNGEVGTWTINDPCGTGDSYITGDIGGNAKYPGLLLEPKGSETTTDVQFCTGIIVSDVLIDPAGYEGADAQVVIRHNGQTGNSAYSYGLVLSIDNTPSGENGGYIVFQKCGGGSCSWHGGTANNPVGIVGNKWFRVKIEVTQSGNDYVFRAKVWAKGDPEPSGWTTTWTDSGAASDANYSCTGNWTDWRPGVNLQRGDSGSTTDSYNNFVVYQPRTSANSYLYDTIPTGINFVGCTGGCSSGGGMVNWNLGNISNESGSYTWWGIVNTCTPVVNKGALDGDDPVVPVESNEVSLDVECRKEISITKTASPNIANVGDTITFQICYENTGQMTTDVEIWDTVPSSITVIDTGGGVVNGSLLIWSIPSVPVGGSGCETWTGQITGLPYYEYKFKEIFAEMDCRGYRIKEVGR